MESMKRNPEAIARCIREAETIAVVSHVNPDGDTLGSATAMYLALTAMGKKVSLFCDGKVPDQMSFLPGADQFRIPEGKEGPFDLMLSVDVSDERLRGPEIPCGDDRADRPSSDKSPVHAGEQCGRGSARHLYDDPGTAFRAGRLPDKGYRDLPVYRHQYGHGELCFFLYGRGIIPDDGRIDGV